MLENAEENKQVKCEWSSCVIPTDEEDEWQF